MEPADDDDGQGHGLLPYRRWKRSTHAARRAELKGVLRRPSSTAAERAVALAELRRQPCGASATRVRNRDSVDARPRGPLRRFGLSRVRMREQVHAGFLPGVKKSVLVTLRAQELVRVLRRGSVGLLCLG